VPALNDSMRTGGALRFRSLSVHNLCLVSLNDAFLNFVFLMHSLLLDLGYCYVASIQNICDCAAQLKNRNKSHEGQ